MKIKTNYANYVTISKLVFIVKIHLFVCNAILKKDGMKNLMMMENAHAKMVINNIKMFV